MNTRKWNTVVVEDQKLFRDLLARMLKSDDRFAFLGAAEDVDTGYALCESHQPDLLLLDIQLAGSDGVDLGKRILKEFPHTRILAVTTLTDPDTINRIMEAGIHGYVEKDVEIDLLEKAMVRVASGGHFKTNRANEAISYLDKSPDSYTKFLSSREQEVLRLVAKGKTSKEVAGQLEISQRTVENHRYNIMKRLDLHSSADLIRYAIEQGLGPK
jgi:DNA-binding NarL/FixJ family response regulator